MSRSYKDLNSTIDKINKAWIYDQITEEQRNELIGLLQSNEPCMEINIQEEIQKIWEAIRAIEARIADNNNNNIPSEIPEWIQPTGVHDAYNIGDRVQYKNLIYESLINSNVWAPDVYPLGWQLIENTEE